LASSCDQISQPRVIRIPYRRAKCAGFKPSVPLRQDAAEIRQDPTIALFHVKQVPVKEKPTRSRLAFKQFLGIIGNQTDMKFMAQILNRGDGVAILKEKGLIAGLGKFDVTDKAICHGPKVRRDFKP
jgi:hypothetical protein